MRSFDTAPYRLRDFGMYACAPSFPIHSIQQTLCFTGVGSVVLIVDSVSTVSMYGLFCVTVLSLLVLIRVHTGVAQLVS